MKGDEEAAAEENGTPVRKRDCLFRIRQRVVATVNESGGGERRQKKRSREWTSAVVAINGAAAAMNGEGERKWVRCTRAGNGWGASREEEWGSERRG